MLRIRLEEIYELEEKKELYEKELDMVKNSCKYYLAFVPNKVHFTEEDVKCVEYNENLRRCMINFYNDAIKNIDDNIAKDIVEKVSEGDNE